MKRRGFGVVTALTVICLLFSPILPQSIQDEAEVLKILRQRLDVDKKGVGVVVGVFSDKGSRVIGYGKMKAGEPRPVDGFSIFEIGSISKVFTCILLADMVARGEMKLDDPISKYLPKTVKTPTFNGKEITLVDLATHTSGLPRMPSNFRPKDPLNPFADYSVEQLYEFLSGVTISREIGSRYDYSNVGMGLLGHILTLKTGSDYESLVVNRICKPLGMNDTRVTLTAEQKTRLATGHNMELKPVPNWDVTSLAGAGALRSTVNDMLKFAAANLGVMKTSLLPVLQKSHEILRKAGDPSLEIALGWHVWKKYGTEIVWHNGGTGGYRTFFGFDPKKRAAVVVLTNSGIGQDDIGLHILESQFALQTFAPPKARREVKVDPGIFDSYVGVYELTPAFALTVTKDNGRLFAQATEQPRFELYAESETKYFYKAVDAQVAFVRDDKGDVVRLILQQGGATMTARKIK